MTDDQSKDEHSKNEMLMGMLFGEGINSLSKDEFLVPNEENRIFLEVFYGNSVIDASNHTVASQSLNFQLGKDSQSRSPRDKESLTSYSSMKETLGKASHPGNVYFNELQETHRWDGSDVYSGDLKRMKLSPSVQGHNLGLSDTCHDKVGMYQGEVDGIYDMDDTIPLKDECKSHDLHYASAKSVTSPVSQESSVSGLLVAGVTSEMFTCKKHSKRDSSITNSYTMDNVLKKTLMKDLPERLRSHAHHLLTDAGWQIDPRVRSDRAKLAYYYLGPEDKRVITALSQAWKLCGQSLLNAADKVSNKNGRQWPNIDAFWNDMTDTLIYMEKKIKLVENSISLLQRWQLLDPFVAVVCINRNISVLREGKAVKVVNSVTYILSEQNSTATKDLDKGDFLTAPSSGSDSCLDQNSLINNKCKTSEVPGKQLLQHYDDLQSGSKCKQEKGKLSSRGKKQRRGLKELQRHNLNDSYNGGHSRYIDALNLSACGSLANSMIPQNEETKKDPLVYKPEPDYGLLTFSMKSDKVGTVDDSKCKELNSARNSIIPGKKTQKKSKKISEIGATKIIDSCDRKLPDFSEIPAFEKFDDHFQRPQSREESQTACCQSTSSLIVKEHASAEDCSPTDTHEQDTESGIKAAKQQSKERNKKQNVCIDDAPIANFLHKDKDGANMHNPKKNKCTSRLLKSKTLTNLGKSQLSSSKMLEHGYADSEDLINFASETKNNGIESQIKLENEDFITSGVSQGSVENKKVAKSKKSSASKKNRQKRPREFLIDDDDLLVAAIIKHKDYGSCDMNLPSKIGNFYSKPLKKLESKIGRCKLLPRTTGKGGKLSKEEKKINLGARTVLCWLIERSVLSLKDVMQYRNPKNNAVIKDGRITLNGIMCSCCMKIYSVSDFKVHSGCKLQKPSPNLLLKSGRSYTLCQLQAWSLEYKSRKGRMKVMDVEELDQNDDTCGVCGDGGELICCDGCPSTYHQLCLPIQDLPEGSWYCHNCICKNCGEAVNSTETSISVDMLECLQCGHKYHACCISGEKFTCKEVESDTWFCRKSCREVYIGLRSRVGLLNHLDDGYSWTILRCNHDDQKVHSAQKIALIAECNTKLAIALTMMEESFLPMVDPRTGINMIPHVLYNWGSSFTRLNYQGFYTAILEKGDTLVAVASLRIHGTTAAEMPLIVTCSKHRRKGICRRLMNAVEKKLKSFKVRMLVLSAIPSLMETWTLGFGFKLMEDDKRKQLDDINLMLLPGTTLLMKNLDEARESGARTNSYPGENMLKNMDGFGEDGYILTAQENNENVKNTSKAEAILAVVENFNEQQEAIEIKLSCPTPLSSRLSNNDVVNSSKFLCLDKTCSSENHENTSMTVADKYIRDPSLASICELASDSQPSIILSSNRSEDEQNGGVISYYNETHEVVDNLLETGHLSNSHASNVCESNQTNDMEFDGPCNGKIFLYGSSTFKDETCGLGVPHPGCNVKTSGKIED